jgi:phage shock protein A
MAMPALLLESENPVEERVARLEANVEHIRSDVSDMKTDIRRLGDKIDSVDQKLSSKIDNVDQKFSSKFDSVLEAIAELRIGRALDRVWWLLMSGALLGIMARAFKWI